MKHFFPEPIDGYEQELLERCTNWEGAPGLDGLTPALLRELTAREGCDFATALLHRRIIDSDRHDPFLRTLSGARSSSPITGMRVAIVPGAFYRENPHTGADGRVIREVAEQLGMPVTVIPVSSTGKLAENARLITEWLTTQRGDGLILASVSKGGSDIKAALSRPDAGRAFERVAGWLNICGILDGSPMADWLLSRGMLARANRLFYKIRGRSLDFLQDLRYQSTSPLSIPLALPPHLRAVHVLGFPLRRHLRNGLARRCHARLESFGPNDGSILLADAARWPGQLCPVWSADHFLRPRLDERPLLTALLSALASPAAASVAT